MARERCSIANAAVCLGRAAEGRKACLLCERKQARDAFRQGEMSLEQFAAVLEETAGG